LQPDNPLNPELKSFSVLATGGRAGLFSMKRQKESAKRNEK